MSRASQALPPAPSTVPEKPLPPETSAPNQSKNMKMKRRIAEIAAIFSPLLSLSSSICFFLRGSRRGPAEARKPTPGRGRQPSVLTSSIAIVIGPTPPGTGVIAAATSAAASKSTSPPRPSSVRFMPTSITPRPA